jgi:Holliday junction resolvase RusA-like endonuclease
LILSFTIPGAPRTKKNHGWRTRHGSQMPSEAFLTWNKFYAQPALAKFRAESKPEMLTGKVNCRALIYRERDIGDAVGYYQAIADALEEGRIVEDDRLIVSWDGSQILKDSVNPRIEITLSTW